MLLLEWAANNVPYYRKQGLAEGRAQDPAPLAGTLRRAMAAVAAADEGNAAQRKRRAQRTRRAARAHAARCCAYFGIHRHPGRSEHDGRHAHRLGRARGARASLAAPEFPQAPGHHPRQQAGRGTAPGHRPSELGPAGRRAVSHGPDVGRARQAAGGSAGRLVAPLRPALPAHLSDRRGGALRCAGPRRPDALARGTKAHLRTGGRRVRAPPQGCLGRARHGHLFVQRDRQDRPALPRAREPARPGARASSSRS